MKSIFSALVLLLAATHVAAGQGAIDLDVKVTRGEAETIVAKTGVQTIDGVAVPLDLTNETTYRASVRRDANGETVVEPGVVKTGVTGSITPTLQPGDDINTHISLSIINLDAVNEVTTDSGFQVQMPQVSTSTLEQDATLKFGTPVTLKTGEYTVHLLLKKAF